MGIRQRGNVKAAVGVAAATFAGTIVVACADRVNEAAVVTCCKSHDATAMV